MGKGWGKGGPLQLDHPQISVDSRQRLRFKIKIGSEAFEIWLIVGVPAWLDSHTFDFRPSVALRLAMSGVASRLFRVAGTLIQGIALLL